MKEVKNVKLQGLENSLFEQFKSSELGGLVSLKGGGGEGPGEGDKTIFYGGQKDVGTKSDYGPGTEIETVDEWPKRSPIG